MYQYIIRGRIIDGVSDEPIERGIIAVQGDQIVYAGVEAGFTMPEQAAVIDAETILPGFFDVHAHLTGHENAGDFADGKFFGDQLLGAAYQTGILLDAGFTGIRDMSEAGVYLSRAQKRGILRSPRIMPGGRILGITSGHVDTAPWMHKGDVNHSSAFFRLCDGVDDCLLAVREQFRIGAQFIKICATGGVSSPADKIDDIQFSPDELRVIVEETKRHQSYVAAHCTGNEGAFQALLAGVDCIEHGVVLTQREIDLMAEKNATLVTTLAVSLGVANFPGLPDWMKKKVETTALANIKTIGMARKAGVRIALGTDYSNSKNTPYVKIGEEFHAMVTAGMTPMEAIKAGTMNAAYLTRSNGETGSLEGGKLADIVLVKGNPLVDITCLSDAANITGVFLGGVQVK